MGGSVAIMGAARCQDIRAVVADSPFALQREVVRFAMNRVLRLPQAPLLHLVDILLGYLVGYHFRDVEPLREVRLIAPRPLLLVHGENDTVTDPRDSQALYDAAGEPKELWISPGVEHCGTYFADRAYYSARITTFFRQALGTPALETQSAGTYEPWLVARQRLAERLSYPGPSPRCDGMSACRDCASVPARPVRLHLLYPSASP